MSDSTQQYILRKPITEDDEGDLSAEGMPDYTFNKLFVPLNRQVLTRQIAIITEKVFTYGCMAGRGDALSNKQEVYIDEAGWVDELLAVFGLENKETE